MWIPYDHSQLQPAQYLHDEIHFVLVNRLHEENTHQRTLFVRKQKQANLDFTRYSVLVQSVTGINSIFRGLSLPFHLLRMTQAKIHEIFHSLL